MLIEATAMQIQHMQKALMQMNLHLNNVISDITGATGMAIIKSILAGQRNPKKLAEMRDPRCKSSEEVIRKSLHGNFREDHLFSLKQAVNAYEFYQKMITECNEKIKKNSKDCLLRI